MGDRQYEHYLDALRSSIRATIVDAAHGLGDLGDVRAVPILIELLRNTQDPTIRNAAAVALRELGDERARGPLISLLEDPKTEGNRGTLLYALEGIECVSALPLLVKFAITGNFEVSRQAVLTIRSITSEIDPTIIKSCVDTIDDVLDKQDLDEDRRELLGELLDTFRRGMSKDDE